MDQFGKQVDWSASRLPLLAGPERRHSSAPAVSEQLELGAVAWRLLILLALASVLLVPHGSVAGGGAGEGGSCVKPSEAELRELEGRGIRLVFFSGTSYVKAVVVPVVPGDTFYRLARDFAFAGSRCVTRWHGHQADDWAEARRALCAAILGKNDWPRPARAVGSNLGFLAEKDPEAWWMLAQGVRLGTGPAGEILTDDEYERCQQSKTLLKAGQQIAVPVHHACAAVLRVRPGDRLKYLRNSSRRLSVFDWMEGCEPADQAAMVSTWNRMSAAEIEAEPRTPKGQYPIYYILTNPSD